MDYGLFKKNPQTASREELDILLEKGFGVIQSCNFAVQTGHTGLNST
jgi:hypothetical protein